jgi:PAS domain S-box-containing protein
MRRDTICFDAEAPRIVMVGGQVATRLNRRETEDSSAKSEGVPFAPYSGVERRRAPTSIAVPASVQAGEPQFTADSAAARIAEIYAHMPAMLSVTDENRLIAMVSENWLKLLGYSRDEVIGKPASDFLTPASLDHLRRNVVPQLEAHGQSDGVEVELIRKDGAPLHVLASSRIERDPVTGRRQFLTVSMDLTERKRAEQDKNEAEHALQRSEAHFRAMFENSSELICVVDAERKVRIANPSTAEVLGYRPQDIIGRTITEFLHPDDTAPIEALLTSISHLPGCIAQGEARLKAQDGSWRAVAFSARNALQIPGIEGIFITGRDITQFKRLESQLSDSRRLESIGALAAGVAHDFNNILGAVLGFAKFLVTDLDPAEPQHAYAQRIIAASERGRELVQQIFSFSRAGRVERCTHDLVTLVEESAGTLPALLPERARLAVKLAPRPLVATVNAAEIQQVILNLAINARDALGKKSGTIEIEVAEIAADHEDHRRLRLFEGRGVHGVENGMKEIVFGSSAPAKRFVRITVADSGSGMTPETLTRAMEPFFTTKSRATGTGLGLATVRNIVSATGGCLVVRSAIGRGTSVMVWLPLEEHASVIAVSRPAETPGPSGEGRILVIDEESDVADAIAIGLSRLGYQAVAVTDPIKALQDFARHPEQWKMVVSGQSMAGMTGLQLLAAMTRIRPTLGYILCSGSGDEEVEHAALAGGALHFFRKPVGVEQLAEAIARFAG